MVKVNLERLAKICLEFLVVIAILILGFLAHALLTGGFPLTGLVLNFVAPVGAGIFFLLALVLTVLSTRLISRERHGRLFAAALIVGSVLMACFAMPFLTLPRAIRDADHQFARAFGADWNHLPGDVAATFRPAPLVPSEAIFGYDTGTNYRVDRDVLYKVGASYSLYCDVYYPRTPGPGRNATIIFLHGGAWIVGGRGMDATRLAYFASQGYVVFDVEYRLLDASYLDLEGQFGARVDVGQFTDSSVPARVRGPWTIGDMVADVGDFTKFLATNATRRHGANLSTTVVWGQSAGAHLAGVVGLGYNDPWFSGVFDPRLRLAGVVLYYPPNNASQYFYGSTGESMFHGISPLVPGTPATNPGAYIHYTPSNLVDPADPPCLLFQGTVDKLVPVKNTGAIQAAITAAGGRAVRVLVPFAGHAFDFAPHYGPACTFYQERFLYHVTR